MHKFTTGLITGGIIGAVGLGMAMTDKKTRRHISKDSKRMLHKANGMLDKMNW